MIDWLIKNNTRSCHAQALFSKTYLNRLAKEGDTLDRQLREREALAKLLQENDKGDSQATAKMSDLIKVLLPATVTHPVMLNS